YPKARLHGAIGELNLERVPAGADVLEADRLEHLPAEALEPACQVAHVQAQHQARVGRAALADEPPQQAPVADAPARDVARAERASTSPAAATIAFTFSASL